MRSALTGYCQSVVWRKLTQFAHIPKWRGGTAIQYCLLRPAPPCVSCPSWSMPGVSQPLQNHLHTEHQHGLFACGTHPHTHDEAVRLTMRRELEAEDRKLAPPAVLQTLGTSCIQILNFCASSLTIVQSILTYVRRCFLSHKPLWRLPIAGPHIPPSPRAPRLGLCPLSCFGTCFAF